MSERMFDPAGQAEVFFTFSHLGEDGLLVGRIWSTHHGAMVEISVQPPPGLSLGEAVELARMGRLVVRYGSRKARMVNLDGQRLEDGRERRVRRDERL